MLKAMCILGSGPENRGELAHVVIGSWSGTDFTTYCVLTESVQEGADVEKEVDDQEEDSSLPDENEAVSVHDGCTDEFYRSGLFGLNPLLARIWQKNGAGACKRYDIEMLIGHVNACGCASLGGKPLSRPRASSRTSQKKQRRRLVLCKYPSLFVGSLQS